MGWISDGAAVVGVGAALTGGYYCAQWSTTQVLGSTLCHGPQPREIALTFDDGPAERYTQEILELLAGAGVRATFFLLGRHAQQLPWLVREMAAAGHGVGNHTMTHRSLAFRPAAVVREELAGCSAILEDLTGAPVHYFRPPFGRRRPAVLRMARELGLQPVMWNSMGYDWRRHRTAKQVLKAVERGIRRNRRAGHGSTVLLHDGAPDRTDANRGATVAATASLLERGHAAGYRFVTVADWWPAAAVRLTEGAPYNEARETPER